jgi:hypothetical protein
VAIEGGDARNLPDGLTQINVYGQGGKTSKVWMFFDEVCETDTSGVRTQAGIVCRLCQEDPKKASEDIKVWPRQANTSNQIGHLKSEHGTEYARAGFGGTKLVPFPAFLGSLVQGVCFITHNTTSCFSSLLQTIAELQD